MIDYFSRIIDLTGIQLCSKRQQTANEFSSEKEPSIVEETYETISVEESDYKKEAAPGPSEPSTEKEEPDAVQQKQPQTKIKPPTTKPEPEKKREKSKLTDEKEELQTNTQPQDRVSMSKERSEPPKAIKKSQTIKGPTKFSFPDTKTDIGGLKKEEIKIAEKDVTTSEKGKYKKQELSLKDVLYWIEKDYKKPSQTAAPLIEQKSEATTNLDKIYPKRKPVLEEKIEQIRKVKQHEYQISIGSIKITVEEPRNEVVSRPKAQLVKQKVSPSTKPEFKSRLSRHYIRP